MTNGHSFTTEIPSGLDQLLRNLFPGEPNHGNDFIFQRATTGTDVETAHTAVNSQEAATVSDQGTFLSNLLHQIMPVVSQHINGGADGSSSVSSSIMTFLCDFYSGLYYYESDVLYMYVG